MKNILRANPEDSEALKATITDLVGLLLLRQSVLTGLPKGHPHREIIEASRDSAQREIDARFEELVQCNRHAITLASQWEERFLRCNEELKFLKPKPPGPPNPPKPPTKREWA